MASVVWQALSVPPSHSGVFTSLKPLWEAKLPQFLLTTLWLSLGVGSGVALLGVGSAWAVSRYAFPGSHFFKWALLFPLAFPPYLAAYLYTDLLQIGGPIQTFLSSWLQTSIVLPSIRTLEGAILVMSFFYFPYVFLLTRDHLDSQNPSLWESAKLLGQSEWRMFKSLGVSQVRNSLMAGMAMALMETLGDFGTMEYFAVDTLATGIYRVWYGQNNKATAAQLAMGLLLLILILLQMEKRSRKKGGLPSTLSGPKGLPTVALTPGKQAIAFLFCSGILLIGFVLPLSYLMYHFSQFLTEHTLNNIVPELTNSFSLATLSASFCICIAFVLHSGRGFLHAHSDVRFWHQLSSVGYAIPGSVMAVGVVWVLGKADQVFTYVTTSGTVMALVYAHSSRFVAIPLQALSGARTCSHVREEQASFLLGARPLKTLLKVVLPGSRSTLVVAFCLVFIDSLKELSATVFLRPFHFETMSVKIYLLASDERLQEASPYALILVMAGVVSVILIQLFLYSPRSRTPKP